LPSNNGGSVYRAYEGVDMCNQEGSIVMCYIRGGEWVHELLFRVDPNAYHNFNVDYFELALN
ncbi:MAG TPA: hypothetical protein VIU34_08510, partial [Steroidobacter sp.]